MGAFEDLRKYPDTVMSGLCEIMVHPDFDKSGNIVDRVGWDEEDYPIGNKLQEIQEYIKNCAIISYGAL